MKKSAVLTALMAMAICGSVSAANPFADVPAGHWAYDSISRLAAAGVIEGYGDDIHQIFSQLLFLKLHFLYLKLMQLLMQ